MKDFLEHTYQIIRTSLERYLYLKRGDSGVDDSNNDEKNNNNNNVNQLEKSFDVKSIRSLNIYEKYASKKTLRDILKSKRNLSTIEGK